MVTPGAPVPEISTVSGAEMGMLYVESDNVAAQHLYADLGFELAWTDVAVGLPGESPP